MEKLGQYKSYRNWYGDWVVRMGKDGRYFSLTTDQQARVIDRISYLSAKGSKDWWPQSHFHEQHKMRALARLCDFAVGDEWVK